MSDKKVDAASCRVSDLEKELKALEQATAADVPAEPLAAETQSLREAWLAFGQLLKSAEPPAEPAIDRPPRRRSRRWPLVAAATAASLLLCLSAVEMRKYVDQPGKVGLPPAVASANAVRPAPVVKQSPTASTTGELAWDDSLDDEIAKVGQQMANIEPNFSYASGAFDTLQYDLQQFQKEMEEDKL